MEKFIAGVKRFWREEEGTEVVEWAMVAGLIVAVGAVVFGEIGDQVLVNLEALLTAMTPTTV